MRTRSIDTFADARPVVLQIGLRTRRFQNLSELSVIGLRTIPEEHVTSQCGDDPDSRPPVDCLSGSSPSEQLNPQFLARI
jgi:hypothetical protein